jgi:hypothetical protein
MGNSKVPNYIKDEIDLKEVKFVKDNCHVFVVI